MQYRQYARERKRSLKRVKNIVETAAFAYDHKRHPVDIREWVNVCLPSITVMCMRTWSYMGWDLKARCDSQCLRSHHLSPFVRPSEYVLKLLNTLKAH
jgi:hypothetical protein